MGNSKGGRRLFSFFLSLYMVTVALAATYYNWEFARTHGFFRWVFFGEVVPTARAFVWPYFVLHERGPTETTNLGDAELKSVPLTAKQIAETETRKVIVALNYSQQATYLLNSNPHENLADYPNLQEVLAYRRKAIEVGKSAN